MPGLICKTLDEKRQRLEKLAGELETAYSLSGQLYASKSGWILLSVPNDLVRGVFAAMDEPGIELPTRDTDDPEARLNAHCSVIRPEELERIGGIDKISERGKRFRYRLGGLYSVVPEGWNGVSRAWMLEVFSPSLQKLRLSYGLSALPNEGKYKFHITVAIRRAKVLGRNEMAKGAPQQAAS